MVPPIPPSAPDDLAAAYQPRRVWAAAVSIGWNLALAGGFVASGGPWWIYHRLLSVSHIHALLIPIYLILLFIAYAAANYPLDLWFGYLEERHFGLVKDGIRAWTRDWAIGNAQHVGLFVIGAYLLLGLQTMLATRWLACAATLLLVLFLLSSYFAVDLLPRGLFRLEPADEATTRRLTMLAFPLSLPPLIIFTSPTPRGFSGGIMGLANRQVMLLSRSTVTAASNALLRFVLRHDAGHRQHHHPLLATLAGWAWVVCGLAASDRAIRHYSPAAFGLPPYVAGLALTMSLWMAAGEPLLAWLGRRLEYQADRFYLRHGGTIEEMRTALEELSRRNLARTEAQRRRETIFHPLPSVWNRLHAATAYVQSVSRPSTLPTEPEGAA